MTVSLLAPAPDVPNPTDDLPRPAGLDALARLAAYICGVPTAAVNLLDDRRQCSVAAYGWQPADVPVDESMCAVSVTNPDVTFTADAGTDPRWRGNPFVTGVRDRVRFYAAAPLVRSTGSVAGTVCAFDSESRDLTRLQVELLRDVAEQAVLLLELHDEATTARFTAHRDGLTGLPNRTLFEHSLGLALARHARGESRAAVLFLDLDGFKDVNDRLGHAAGDDLLRAVTQRLLGCLRATDLLARLGGDELVVLCEAPEDPQPSVEALVGRMRAVFAEPFEIGGVPVRTGASIGIAIADGEGPHELVARADAAMYAEKRRRRAAR